MQRLAVVSTLLEDLLYISYLMPAVRIRGLVPSVLPLRTIGDKVLVSVVVMRNTDVGPVWLPWPRQQYSQLNIRTYVNDPVTGGNGVFFFRSGITSLLSLALPRLLGLPWERIRLHIETGPDPAGLRHYKANGDFDGKLTMEVREEKGTKALEHFSSVHDAAVHITAPDVGYTAGTGRQRLLFFRVEHEFVEPVTCELINLQLPLLDQLGVVTFEEMRQPHSVFLVPKTRFLVHLPPMSRRL